MLSAFDGVGAAPWLVWDLIGEPRAIFSWEVDRAAIQVADYHTPFPTRRWRVLGSSSPCAVIAVKFFGMWWSCSLAHSVKAATWRLSSSHLCWTSVLAWASAVVSPFHRQPA